MLLAFLAGLCVSQSPALVPPEIENEQILGINKQPWHSTLMPYATVGEALKANRYASTFARSLNGQWKFSYVPRPEQRPVDFYKTDYSDASWKTISVPSNWQVLGYGTPYYRNAGYTFERDWPRVMSEPPKYFTAYEERNPVGSYRRTFTVPSGWKGRQVFLSFDGVDSAFYLWINGQKVGYSQNSRNVAEFDVTPYLQEGKPNLVALEVYRYSAGSYFEDQDMWRLSGIFRNVTLWSTPKLHIRDTYITTDLDGQYKDATLKVVAKVHNYDTSAAKTSSVKVALYDRSGKPTGVTRTVSTPAIPAGGEAEVVLSSEVPNPAKWTAETPNLYTAVVSLGQSETLSFKTGFRKVEIKGRIFMVNGVPVKLKGANRHEHWPETGHVVSEAQMIRDIEVLKQANCNHVRTCHYSDDPRWYELCDQYGIYLVAEANAECHGYYGVLDREPRFEKMVVDRNVANVENFKNHPSVLIWSLGNECGGGSNFRACIPVIKAIDPTRPVHYEAFGIGKNNPADIDSQMYQSVDGTDRIAKNERGEFTKPYYLCEYAHAMFNSMGSIGEYNDVFDKHPELMGGAIWEWEDQGLWNRRDPKRPYLAYGGGFGEVPNDHYFIHKGVVFSDRSPKPHYPEVKRVYQWIGFAEDDLHSGKVKIKNKYAFTNLDKFDFYWQIASNGKAGAFQKLEPISLAPGQEKVVELPLPRIKPGQGVEYHLNLQARLRKDESWAKAGYDIAAAQFKLPIDWPLEPIKPDGSLSVKDSGNQTTISNEKFTVRFDHRTGTIDTLALAGEPNLLIADGGPKLHLWRSQHRNDDGYAAGDWYKSGLLHLNAKPLPLKVATEADGSVTVSSSIQYTGQRRFSAVHVAVYHIYPDGTITVDNTVSPSGPKIVLARVGVRMLLDKKLDQVSYFARGPMENYSDRKRGSDVGFYSSTVAQQMTGYAKPMEQGNHEDTRWVTLQGKGLPALVAQADGDALLQFSALPYMDEEMENVEYSVDLPPSKATVLCLSGKTLGAGSAGCGPRPLPQYMLYSDPASFTYVLRLLPPASKVEGRIVPPVRPQPVTMAYDQEQKKVALQGGSKELFTSTDGHTWNPYREAVSAEPGTTFWVQSQTENGFAIQFPLVTPSAPPAAKIKVSASSYQPEEGESINAVDGDPNTYWHTRWDPSSPRPPHYLTLDLLSAKKVSGLKLTPRQDMENGRVKEYEIYTSADGKEWGRPIKAGSLPNSRAPQTVKFDSPVRTQFLRIVVVSEQTGQNIAAIGEVDVLVSP